MSWPVALSQGAQGQLSTHCRVFLASVPSSFLGGEGGEFSRSAMPRLCTAQGSDTGAPQSSHPQMAAVDQML